MDFLQELITLGDPERFLSPHRTHRSIAAICSQIEEIILGGSILMDPADPPEYQYPRLAYRPKDWESKLPLVNTSSMVSELAPVVLHLRHVVNPGDVLIIEEPEAHLHPAMQVQLMRQLAAMIKAGIHMIVMTHSGWVLEELANLVRLSSLPESGRAGIDGSDLALEKHQVGVWLFEPGRHDEGSGVTQIEIDESGLYPSGLDDVAVQLHNNWAQVTRQLEN